jgi:hypothetical protein
VRTISSTSGTTGRTRRAPVATTIAALCLSIPMALALSGTAYAANDQSADHGNSANAPGQVKKTEAASTAPAATAVVVEAKPAGFIGPVAPASATLPPYTNAGGVTTGANTTSYETVADKKGSTFTGVGGGQPSGDIHSPQPFSTADNNNTGANDTSATNQYRSTRDGSPSLNGNGGGKQVGQPCAGCVGKADNKNPPGQAPNGSDHNAGYECDRNHGIGRSNPAHTGCTTPPVVKCVPKAGEDSNCKPIVKCVPKAGEDSNCKPIVKCVPKAGEDSNCKPIVKCVPKAGEDSNCNPIVKCVPKAGEDSNCNPPKCVPTAAQDKDCKTPGSACVPVGNQDRDCNPPRDCLGVVNGTATQADCTPPLVCPPGSMVGPIVPGTTRPGCTPLGGGSGAPAQTPTVIAEGTNPQPVLSPVTPTGTTTAPGTALPFTGSNTALLIETAALMLLVGGGLMLATRKPRPARAIV